MSTRSRKKRDKTTQQEPLYREPPQESWEEIPKEEKKEKPKDSKIDYYIEYYI